MKKKILYQLWILTHIHTIYVSFSPLMDTWGIVLSYYQ